MRTARELAEREGWPAVTIRRLAERVEYSQPVLYSHFPGRDAIVGAVAVQGFDELTGDLRRARRTAPVPDRMRAVTAAYLDFATTRQALYDAMFVLPTDLAFGTTDATPAPLAAAFEEIVIVLQPLAAGRSVDTVAEVVWSALHGLATLSRSGRIRPDECAARLDVLVGMVLGDS